MAQPAAVKMNHALFTFDSAKDLAREAALRWLDAMADCDLFTVALSGGRIPKLLYAEVVAQASEDAFANVHFFWGDERCVSPTDEESNFKLAAVRLLLALKVPESQVHRILTERGEAFAVQQAESEICRIADLDENGQPVLDLVFLGLGEDGHVASIFPCDTEAMETQAVYRAVTGPKPPLRRITLGYPALAAAREVWVLAAGEGKKESLGASLANDGDTPLARVLKSRTHTEIFTDFDLA